MPVRSICPSKAARLRPGVVELRTSRRRLAAGVGVALLIVGVVLAVTDPFSGNSPSGNGVAERRGDVDVDGETPGSLAADAGERDTGVRGHLDGVGAEWNGAGGVAAGAAVDGGRAADVRRRRARAHAGAGIARRRSAEACSRLQWRQRGRKHRAVRKCRAGGRRRPAECHGREREGAGRPAIARGGGVDACTEREHGCHIRTERGVHDPAEGRANPSGAVSRCTRSVEHRRFCSTALCRCRARSCPECRRARTSQSRTGTCAATGRRAATRSPRRRRLRSSGFSPHTTCPRPASSRWGRSCSSRARCA